MQRRDYHDRNRPASALFYKGLCLGGACLLLAALPVLILLCLYFLVFLLAVILCFILLAIIFSPLAVILAYIPKLRLLGYERLNLDVSKLECTKQNGNGASPKNASIIAEISSLLSLSDLVYIYMDFRKLSILGSMPVSFNHIMLESDKMSQMDIIYGEPHKEKAFVQNGGVGGAGIRPSILFVTILKFLVSKAEEQRIMGLSKYIKGKRSFRKKRLGSDGNRLRGPTLGLFRKSERRSTLSLGLGGGPSLTTLERAQGGDMKWGGISMFEDLFLKSLLTEHSSRSCSDHHLEGTLCSESGLHGMQCFIDSLVELSKQGNKESEELIHLLTHDDEGDVLHEDLDTEIAQIGKLLCSVVGTKKVLKVGSILYTTIMDIENNDSRIVWTNDRMGDAECCYIIVVSRQRRRVTVIFRGTTTLNDIMKNADFDVLLRDNPISELYPGKTETIEMNNGYGSYIFVEREDTKRTKFDEITDRIHEYGEELGSDYSVHVTGHSMGGALAVLFAFYASFDKRFAQKNNPVCVYTFAAAIPGRISFAKAFQHQEKVGLVRHLRIINEEDIVPLAHPQSIRTFAHTGISMVFHHERLKILPSIKYVADPSWWSSWSANLQTNILINFPWLKPKSVGVYHGCNTYAKRLEQAKANLTEQGIEQVTLNDLYQTYANITESITESITEPMPMQHHQNGQPQAPPERTSPSSRRESRLKSFVQSVKFKALRTAVTLPRLDTPGDETLDFVNNIDIPDEFMDDLDTMAEDEKRVKRD